MPVPRGGERGTWTRDPSQSCGSGSARRTGYALPTGARWWYGLLDPVPEGFTNETGSRTFAINEINVSTDWRGQGVATRLHQELVTVRPEERFTLLVEPENEAGARRLYLSWGYEMVARLQPYPDAPVYDALVLDLKARRTRLAG